MKPLRARRIWARLIVLLLCGMVRLPVCAAGDYFNGFDSPLPSWKLKLDPQTLQSRQQIRSQPFARQGKGAEYVEIESLVDGALIRLEHPLPQARLIEELKLSLWYRGNGSGAKLAVRVVFPNQKDPRNGNILSTLIEGDEYTRTDRWQKLECKDIEASLQRKLPLLQAQLSGGGREKKTIDTRGLYLDLVVLNVPAGQGTVASVIDDLAFGPVVSPADAGQVVQMGANDQPATTPGMTFRSDRVLQFQGRPCFPRWLPYHGEPADQLQRMGFNLVWVPDYRDQELLKDLNKHGLPAIATPPRVSNQGNDEEASLAPFGPESANIVLWLLGTRIPADALSQLTAWTEQVRNADRVLKRPVLADVVALERTYSRHLDMTGVSRHVLHSTFGLKSYRNWLIERRQFAQPGSFLWTWVQTEPVAKLVEDRRSAGLSPIVVEPEQLRLLVYSSLAAGYRGIGYWTLSTLESETPSGLERKLALAQINMQLELLEPWLATSRLQAQIPFSLTLPRTTPVRQLDIGIGVGTRAEENRDRMLRERDNQSRRQEQVPRELEAALFRTDFGQLLMPIWYGESAQFVPGQMAANNVLITVPGIDETASPWEVTTTGIRSLTHKRVTGGVQITLPMFDQTAAVIFSADRHLVDTLRKKAESMQERSASVCLQLARSKLNRVTETDRELHRLSVGQADSTQILASANRLLERSQAELKSGDFDQSRQHSAGVMQATRILQHAYWLDAVRNLSSPVSSPHTLCFQTLPEHWQLVRRLGRGSAAPPSNLLRSGDFEDRDTMVTEGWRREQPTIEGVRATAEQYPVAHKGTYSLRLIAVSSLPGSSQPGSAGKSKSARDIAPPPVIRERPVTVVSPPVVVRKGQLVYIGGWARMVAGSGGSSDGALFYDSIGGPTTALRWRDPQDWQHFEILREVPESGDLTITAALTGIGELLIDDLQVQAYEPETEVAEPSAGSLGKPKPSPFDFLKKLPGFGAKETPPTRR